MYIDDISNDNDDISNNNDDISKYINNNIRLSNIKLRII